MGIPWPHRPWTPLPWTPFPPTNHPSANHPPAAPTSANLDRMAIDGPGFRMGEVQAVNNRGFAGQDMARGPTLPSSSRADAPPLRRIRGMPSAISAPSAPLVPPQYVATHEVIAPRATNFATTAPTNRIAAVNNLAVPLDPTKKSDAARLRLREQRQTASASRKEEDKTRARARQTRAIERV